MDWAIVVRDPMKVIEVGKENSDFLRRVVFASLLSVS
jgi:hypothetical protein